MGILEQALIILGSILVALILLALVIAIIYWRVFKLCHNSKLAVKQKRQQANTDEHDIPDSYENYIPDYYKNNIKPQPQFGLGKSLYGFVP